MLRLIPFVVGSSSHGSSHNDDMYYQQQAEEHSFDKLNQFTFIGSGPCRIEGEKVSDYVRLLTAGSLNDCADRCLDSKTCLGFQYRYSDDKNDDCALFKNKAPTHHTSTDRDHECWKLGN